MQTDPIVRGFAYGATRTFATEGMRRFFAALGVEPSPVVGATATMYRFADGSFFGVVEPDGPDDPAAEAPGGAVDDRRIVGFRVTDLAVARAALEAAGFPVIDAHENELSRYGHVEGPDGRLYELVELLGDAAGPG